MKTGFKKILVLIILASAFSSWAIAEEKPAGLSEEQKKAMELLEAAKKKADALMQERNSLIQQNAQPEQVQAKTAEIMQAQKDAIETLRKNFPQGLPPIPGMVAPPPGPPKLSPADQAALDSLIAQRKQMVLNGATFEEVQPITEQIQEKYYGRKMTPPSAQNLVKSTAESSAAKPA